MSLLSSAGSGDAMRFLTGSAGHGSSSADSGALPDRSARNREPKGPLNTLVPVGCRSGYQLGKNRGPRSSYTRKIEAQAEGGRGGEGRALRGMGTAAALRVGDARGVQVVVAARSIPPVTPQSDPLAMSGAPGLPRT